MEYRIQLLDGEEPTVGDPIYELPTPQTSLEIARSVARSLYLQTKTGWRDRAIFGVRVIDGNGRRMFERNFVAALLTDGDGELGPET